jgi:transposase
VSHPTKIGRVITVQDWAEIRRLHSSEGMSRRGIAQRLGVARATVDRALANPSPPKYQRPPVPSMFDAVKLQVRLLLQEDATLSATVIAERVGWSGSPSWFRKQVALLRPLHAPVDPADRLRFEPGDAAQCDLWFPEGLSFPVGRRREGFPVLVMVSCHSRHITAVMIPTRTTADLLAGTWQLLSEPLGAVPHRLIWDNEAGIGRRNRLAEGVAGFMGTLGSRIVQLPPRDPESKGVVERAIQYLEDSFLPARTFTDPADFNSQLQDWLEQVAHRRFIRSLQARPGELIGADRAAMLALPPVTPAFGFTARVRLGRDYYLRVLSNDYSVDPVAIGRMVDVQADLHSVTVHLDGLVLARHERAWGSAQVITDPEHVASAKRLREAFQARSSQPPTEDDDGLTRDLADYDAAFDVAIEPVEWVA